MKSHQILNSRIFEIDAGHRIYGHEGKCAHIHGHRYKIEVFARRKTKEQTDDLGRVIDFSVLKDMIGKWLDDKWDHGMILWEKDPISLQWMQGGMHEANMGGMKYHLLPYNPTAENMARYLLEKVCPNLLQGTDVEVAQVIVYETPNCSGIAAVE